MVMPENSPVQRILFGPPGSGKSFRARQIGAALKADADCTIEATFHPAYDYGDFVVKLLPMTVQRVRQFHVAGSSEEQKYEIKTPTAESAIEYRVHVGHLIRAVAKALQVGPAKNVLLIIDEINRGDCARIFGDMFQLLDRNSSGWSEYGVNLSDLAFAGLMKELGWISQDSCGAPRWVKGEEVLTEGNVPKDIWNVPSNKRQKLESLFAKTPVLHLPPNLSIIGTMNTSDESVYYMDTAFKRRWAFEFLSWNYGPENVLEIKTQREARLEGTSHTWENFLKKLNDCIGKSETQRRIDDKQVGLWFLRSRLLSLYVAFQKAAGVPSPTVLQWQQLGLAEAPGDASGKVVDWNSGLDQYVETILGNDGADVYQQLVTVNNDDQAKNPSPRLAAMRLAGLVHWEITISAADLRYKLMHFLWDNVFSRDRETLENLIFPDKKGKLSTFDDFVLRYEDFIHAVMTHGQAPAGGTGETSPDGNA